MSSDDPSLLLLTRLRALVSAPGAVDDLRAYFGIGLAPDTKAFTGSRFEHLGGGGDRPTVADTITAEDLIAVQTLSVTVPASAALDLLEGPLRTELSLLLGAIPTGLDLVDADAAQIRTGSPADRAWHLLKAQHGIGWVTAGKVLARKRPRLLPVYDDVVRCALGQPVDFWLSLHAALRADGADLQQCLIALREEAKVPETVGALRVCDVAVWMGHRLQHHTCT
jgi:hypothetical protein